MRLKGLRITRKGKQSYEVVPLYFGRKGREMAATANKSLATNVADGVAKVVATLVARGDLTE